MTVRALVAAAAVALASAVPACTSRSLPPAVAPASAPPRATLVTSVEGITEHRLPNGLRIVLFPDPSHATITVNMTYFVGSRVEGYGEAGMAHLLEHMLFRGTARHPELARELEQRGATANGTTWYDRTNYYATLPASDDNLALVLDIEADRMKSARLSDADLARERAVVENELDMVESDPATVLSQRMHAAAFVWHAYGRAVIGTRADLRTIDAEALRRFYRTHYRPDNAMLVVAGRFDPARTLATIERRFGALTPAPGSRRAAPATVEPPQDGERQVTLRRVGDVAIVGVLYHGVAGADEAFVATEALVHLLVDEPSGRLYRALVRRGLAARVWGAVDPLAEPGVIELYAEVREPRLVPRVTAAMLATIEGVRARPPTAAEIGRYRAHTLKELALALTAPARIAVDLSEWAAQGDWRLLFVYRDRVETLTAAAVRDVASRFLAASNRTIGAFLPTRTPERAPAGARPDVTALVQGYRGRPAPPPGEPMKATVAEVERRTTRVTLPGGMRLALLPKQTRGGAVRAVLHLRYGTPAALRRRAAAAELAPELLLRGTRRRGHQALLDELARLKAEVTFAGEAGVVSARILTVREHLPAVLELVAEALREPAFRADALAIVKKERVAELAQARSDPTQQAERALRRRLAPWPADDVRYVPTFDEEIARIEAVRLADLRALHRLWGATHAEVAVVGDLDPAAVGTVVLRRLARWRSPRRYRRIETPYAPVPPAAESVDTPDKELAYVAVGLPLAVRDDDSDYPALAIANHLYGGGELSRLWTRLREREGWSYGAGSFLEASALDRRAELIAGAMCPPDKADATRAAMIEELARLVRDGITAAELDRARAAWRARFEGHLASDDWLVEALAEGLQLGRTLRHEQWLADEVAALTPADVRRVLRKGALRAEELVTVLAGDLAATLLR